MEAIHKLKERLKEASDNQKSLKISLQDVQERLRSERAEANSKTLATKGSLSMAWLVEVRVTLYVFLVFFIGMTH